MYLHGFCSMQTAILIILAAGVAVNSSEDDVKKTVDLIFVVERSPLVEEGRFGSVSQEAVSWVIFQWIDHWLHCVQRNKKVVTKDLEIGYMGFILDTEDKLTKYSPSLIDDPVGFRNYSYAAVPTKAITKFRPHRLQEMSVFVKKAKDAILDARPDERKGLPVMILWHVPYMMVSGSRRAMQDLQNRGLEAVILFDASPSDAHKGGNTKFTLIECCHIEEFFFEYGHDSYCVRLAPFIDKFLGMVCETGTNYTQCYYNDRGDCLVDSSYTQKDWIHPQFRKYCRSGIKKIGEKCRTGKDACRKQCERIMVQLPCSVSCGTGVEKTIRPPVTDKFIRHCPETEEVCERPPCPVTVTRRPVTTGMKTALITTPSTVRPSTRRPVATRTTMPVTTTPAGIVLQPWMIAVLVVAAVAVLAVTIAVLACCLRKGRRPAAAGAGGHWRRFYTRQSAPRRHHPVARSPGRTHDRHPPRYLSKPRAPSPADHHRAHAPSRPSHTPSGLSQAPSRPSHAPSRPSHAPNRPSHAPSGISQAPSRPSQAPSGPSEVLSRSTLTSKRPAYASMAPTVQSGLPPRRQY